MEDYGWYGQARYDYEPLDPPKPPSPYSRAMSVAYAKGKAAAVEAHPVSPYKRADFDECWQLGLEQGLEDVGKSIERFLGIEDFQ